MTKCFSNLRSLLRSARQINQGWDFRWHGDAAFNFCEAEAGLTILGYSSVGAHYQILCCTTMGALGSSREIKQTYEQSYDAIWCTALLIFKLSICCLNRAERLYYLCSFSPVSIACKDVCLSQQRRITNKVYLMMAQIWTGGAMVSFAR